MVNLENRVLEVPTFGMTLGIHLELIVRPTAAILAFTASEGRNDKHGRVLRRDHGLFGGNRRDDCPNVVLLIDVDDVVAVLLDRGKRLQQAFIDHVLLFLVGLRGRAFLGQALVPVAAGSHGGVVGGEGALSLQALRGQAVEVRVVRLSDFVRGQV